MARLNRAQAQERNRARVLEAARDEFTARGFRDAKVDGIAARAGLTRGAVYSNFPGKRALYFAVLAELAERAPVPPHPGTGQTISETLAAFARAWVTGLPLVEDVTDDATEGLGRHLIAEISADDRLRRAFAQLTKLDALLLGLSLESLSPRSGRLVRVAEMALTLLHGASRMADAAPGFADPFDVVAACAGLARTEPDDTWPPPHLAYAGAAHPADRAWAPPATEDALRREPADLAGDGVVVVAGLHRLEAVEEAVRASREQVTAVVVTGDAELAPLARMTLARLRGCLRPAVPAAAWPPVRIAYDEAGAIAAAAGVHAVSDATETAFRVRDGRIVAEAEGRGAAHAAASA